MVCLVLLAASLMLSSAMAATNIGRGNWGADPQIPDNDNITDSSTITINSLTMSVVKVAFLDDATGTQITSGSSVAAGTIVKFIIYVDNSTSVAINDARFEDMLNEVGFTYQTGTLKWNTASTNTGASLATIFTDTNTGTALTDTISGADVGSIDTTQTPSDRITFGAHSAQVNATLNIPAGKIASFIFRARVN